jgi:drug/metabolite transporter (DMT)-like permease
MLQNLWAALVFLPLSGGVSSITGMDLALIGFLGIGCSAIGHTLFVAALRTVRAELAALTSALEPLYGIVFAYLILGEVPNVRTTLGGLLIIVAVTFASMVESLEKSPEEKNPQLSSRVEPTVSTARLS